MAQVEVKDSGKGGKKGQQKKMSIHVDFTPMVDMNMLLITFFMLCTTMSKPQTMEISMPTNDKVTEDEQNEVKASEAVTILLDGDNRIFYYLGEPNYEDYTTLIEGSYAAKDENSIRNLLLERNKTVVNKIKELKGQLKRGEISEEQFDEQSSTVKKDTKGQPTVVIKAKVDDATSKGANYRNLIDALDEMLICSISKYAVVDISEGDLFLMENYKTKGEYGKQHDFGK